MPTRDQLHALYPQAPAAHLAALAGASIRLEYHGIVGAPRLHLFLAQIGHDSGGLTITEENLSYSAARLCAVWPRRFPSESAAAPYARNPEALANKVYGGRMGNGPPESGDGWRYRGRVYIQITGRDGYLQCSRRAGLDLEDAPDLAAAPDQALAVACAFWDWKGLNALCDSGDIVKVTRRINGGTNGLADRRAWLDKVRRVLLDPPRPRRDLDVAGIIALQRALQKAGYPECGAADGVIGPRTAAAIARFRAEKDLGDGGIDDALLTALGLDA